MIFLRRSTPWRHFKIIVGLIACAACCSCSTTRSAGEPRNSNGDDKNSTAAITVTVAKSESRNVPSIIEATGSLIANETSGIAPKVAGKVANVYANVGQFISKGSLVIKIDDTNPRQSLAQAKAAVKQQRSAVLQAEARLGLSPNGTFNASTIPEVRAASANYEQAKAQLRQAEANEKRYRELVETGDVPMVTYETYRTTRDTARAQVNAAKENLDTTVNTAKQNNQAIKSAQAAVEAAQAGVAVAQQAVNDTVVRAPFSGYISSRPVAVGEYATSATVVATILLSNPIKAEIKITEADVSSVSVGQGVSVEVSAYKDRKFAGTITAVNPAIDPASRAATIEAKIENSDNALRSGMFVTAQITKSGGGSGVFVPKAAVYNDIATQSYRAFVVQDGIIKLRVVQLGKEENDSIQILSGVNADETVATSNLDKLYEGAKVSF